MVQTLRNVLTIGASGNLGPWVHSALEADNNFVISTVSRQSSKAKFAPHIKTHSVPDSYPAHDLISAFSNQDVIINMIPITEVALHKKIVDAAIKANVKRLILSEFGTNVPELQTTEPTPRYQGKIEVRDYMESKSGQGLTWTGLVVGAFLDWGLEDGMLGFDLKTRTATIFDSGNVPTNFTLVSTTGKATTAILRNPVETADRYVFIDSLYVTQNEILAALEKITCQKWIVKKTTCQEESRTGRGLLENGDSSGLGPAIMSASYSGGKYDFALVRQLDNELLGLPVHENLHELVAKIVQGVKV